jgi:hypothetical protein
MGSRIRFALLLIVAFAGCAVAFVFGVAALQFEPPSQCDPTSDFGGICADRSLQYGTISIAAAFLVILAVAMIFKPRDKN